MKLKIRIMSICALLLVSATSWGGDYSVIHNFNGHDGREATGALILYSNKLYGFANDGGTNSDGVVFGLAKDGTDFEVLHHFGDDALDGTHPERALLGYGDRLYGMTAQGGTNNNGVIFSLKLDGSDYQVHHRFLGMPADGANPYGSLVYSDGFLYGITSSGGTSNNGAIARIRPDGTGYQFKYPFTNTVSGEEPYDSLVEHNGRFYGMTRYGGTSNDGVIFSLKTDFTDYQVLRNVKERKEDGAEPEGSLFVYDNKLYGMTVDDGLFEEGVLFRMNLDGSQYSNLVHFSRGTGGGPEGTLVEYNGMLFGITDQRGLYDYGTIFSMNPDGSDFGVIHDFGRSREEGKNPNYASPFIGDGVLYGVLSQWGTSNRGVVYALSGSVGRVEPRTLPLSGGRMVSMRGFHLGNGSDITSVTLAGEPAMIITQSQHRVTVLPGPNSAQAGDVVVRSSSQGETRLEKGIVYSPYIAREVPYAWEEIAIPDGGSGTVIAGIHDEDDAYTNVPIGFAFNFFGEQKTNAYVDSNGYIAFEDFDESVYECRCMGGSTNAPSDMVALFWDDLTTEIDTNINPNVDVYYQTLGTGTNRRFIVEYYDVSHLSDDGSTYTFQSIFYEHSGNIKVQYKALKDGSKPMGSGINAVIGIENNSGLIGTDWSCFQDGSVREGMAILFTTNRGSIASASPMYGPQYGGNTVVIDGEQLSDNEDINYVTLNGVAADLLPGQSETQVVVKAGAAEAPGTGEVVVYSQRLGATRLSDGYTYDPWYRPRLAWDATSGATWYWLWISKDGNTYYSKWIEADTEWQPEWDMYPVHYTWWVQPWGPGIGYGPWSAGNRLEIPWPSMQWEPTVGATWYYCWVGKNGSEYYSDWLEGSTNWLPSWNFSPGTYRMWIQPWSDAGGYGTWQSFTNFVVSGKPLSWNTSPGATWYRVWLNRDGADYYDRWVESDNFTTLDWSLPAGSYQWWTQPWGPAVGYGSWKAGADFTLSYGAPQAAVPQSPLGTVVGNRPAFSWDTFGESWYHLWITREGVRYYSEWINRDGHWSPPWDFASGNYEWWVQTWNSSGYGPWSTSLTFTVP